MWRIWTFERNCARLGRKPLNIGSLLLAIVPVMSSGQFHKMRLSTGIQTIRIDRDSLDYDFKGQDMKFHGTLPFENICLNRRYTQTNRRYGLVMLLMLYALAALWVLSDSAPLPIQGHRSAALGCLVVPICQVIVALRRQRPFVAVQIDPPPFGFKESFRFPDDKSGQAFFADLEFAWNASLRRRFLDDDSVEVPLRLNRIAWLQHMGVITVDEAELERERVVGAQGANRIATALIN